VIKVKDTWDAIELLGPEAKTSIKSTDDGIVKGKAVVLGRAMDMKVNRVINAKARTVIIGYYGPEALSKILYLWTVKE
jgi:hypothetical protein